MKRTPGAQVKYEHC